MDMERKRIDLRLQEVALERAKLENADAEANDNSDGASSQGSHAMMPVRLDTGVERDQSFRILMRVGIT